MMKRVLSIICALLTVVLVFAQSVSTTEGTEFWLTFLNNAKWDPTDEQNKGKMFELQVVVTARQNTQVKIELRSVVIGTLNVQAGQSTEYSVTNRQKDIYLLKSQNSSLYQGLRVYTDDKNTPFTCYTYCRAGDSGASMRDMAMVYPKDLLNKEYFIQTYPEDDYSTELAFVVTEDGTDVQVIPTYPTMQAAPLQWTNLKKGTAVLVASAPHTELNSTVGLSGTQICATKPIAVFNGNQATKIPYDGAYSQDYVVEQTLPIVQWGTQFYLGLLKNTNVNAYIITAAYDNTVFEMQEYDINTDQIVTRTITLNKGESIDPNMLESDGVKQDVIITSKPALCYVYTTAAARNYISRNNWGNTSSAMLPAWEHHVKSMPFVTKDLDPNLNVTLKRHYVYVVTPTADTGKLTLDGQAVSPTLFTPFTAAPTMSFASLLVDVSDNKHGHLLETTGEGFIGMVYDMAASQANFYTLGFHYLPYEDSLFVSNTEDVMSKSSYDLTRLPQGWYQRQDKDFPVEEERLDTAVICDNTTLNWQIQTYIQGNTSPVVWQLYDITDDEQETPIDEYTDNAPATTLLHNWQHHFLLPEEKDIAPAEREPFRLYRLDALLHKGHTICTQLDDDIDTLQMVVRVNRIYDDTIHQVICMGETLPFFYDSIDNQGDLTHQSTYADKTTFIGDKTEGESTTPFEWKVRLGKNVFTRHYLTVNGCDSLSTLDLFVCDTFHIEDTVHICDNQAIRWQGKTYAGLQYSGKSNYTVKDSAFFKATYKTQWCACEQDTLYPHFAGCDSIHELHLYVHPTYRDTIEATMCIDGDSAKAYLWTIHEGADQLAITIKNPGMRYLGDRWAGYFYDSLKTKTCPDCQGGLGCDSLRILHLTIPDSYYFEETADFCGGHYDFDLRQIVGDAYTWENHPTGAGLTESGDYYDACKTVFGCDSIYHLALTIHQPYLLVENHTMPNNDTYIWHGKTYGPFTEYPNDTILYFYDDQATHTAYGCDSVIRLDLKVAQTYLIAETREICNGDSILWRGKKIVSESFDYTKAGFTPDMIVAIESPSIIYDSLKTNTLPQCDSVYQLTITVHPVYTILDTIHLCDNDSVIWQGRLYLGNKAIAAGKTPYREVGVGEFDDVCSLQTIYGCDSICHLHLIVTPSYQFEKIDTICQSEAPYIITYGKNTYSFSKTIDTLLMTPSSTECDSVLRLRLKVNPTYYFKETQTICEGDSVEWQGKWRKGKEVERTESVDYFGDRMFANDDYTESYRTKEGCDSIYYLHLVVNPRKHTHTDYDMCDYDTYDFNGKIYDHPTAGIYLDTVHLLTQLGCDSVVTLKLKVNPSYQFEKIDTICQSEAPYSITYGKNTYSFSKTIDTLLMTPSSTECDSVLRLRLKVNPTYYFKETQTICEGDSVEWQGKWRKGKEVERTESVDYFGDRMFANDDYTESYRTKEGCDSIYYLHLVVNPRKHTHTDYDMCDYDTYDFNGKIYDHPTAGIYLDTVHLLTQLGCDSVVTLRLKVNPSYNFVQTTTVCQDTVNPNWEWIDAEGFSHGTISIAKAGDYYITDPYQTSEGCDSIYGVHLRINPIYRFDSIYTICQNERISWQGKWYSGGHLHSEVVVSVTTEPDEHADAIHYTTEAGDIVLPGGIYHDTAHYYTKDGCDSTYYLTLYVKPTYDTIVHVDICDNSGAYIFHPRDTHGHTYKDTITIKPITRYLPTGAKDTTFITRTYSLTTVDGCDSIVYLHLTIHPTYEFRDSAEICYGSYFEWRGKYYNATGIYFDNQPTQKWGCDSTYILELYVKPAVIVPLYRNICDNETFVHTDTLWYTNGNHTEVNTLVWKPGMTIPDTYTDVIFKGADGCDSIIYRYFLTINKTYYSEETATLCSNEGYFSPQSSHYWNMHTEYGMQHSMPAADTTIVDSLTTVAGCDSIFVLHAHILPAYRNVEYDTICSNVEWQWRKTHYMSLPAGEHIYYDSLRTGLGCDSIYEMRLTVYPSYFSETHDTICANGTYLFYGQTLDQTGFYYDSLTTIHSCDSVYHLYLTVLDTTAEFIIDTICTADTFYLHNQPITEPGQYKDTTTNVFGCDHYTYLNLTKVPPTIPTAWTDLLCADDKAYELFVSYTGETPIAYSLYYDDFGHEQGFEDIEDMPIDITQIKKQQLVLSLPMPDNEGDRTHYPRPDHYPIRLVLDNGLCRDLSYCVCDTNIVFSYPSWLTEQRFRDVIAILSPQYNGGYTFDDYQWYKGDTMLIGETHEYLYIPRELDVDASYHVCLTRTGETESYQTCSVIVFADPTDTIAPAMGYLSVVPTYVVKGHPLVSILSRHEGTYTIYSSTGRLLDEGTFTPDVTEVMLPAVNGVYVFQLISEQTPEEPRRTIKVIVGDE